MSPKWHYGIDGVLQNPVDVAELLRLLETGVINPDQDHVWKPGMPAWELPRNVPELLATPPPLPKVPQASAAKAAKADQVEKVTKPPRRPPVRAAAADRDWKELSIHIWIGLAASHLAFRGLSIWAARRSLDVGALPGGLFNTLHLLSLITFVLALSMACIGGWRNWEILQEKTARTAPLQAIAFLFIPFFNLYWIWVASVGLATDHNRYVDQADDGSDKHTSLWFTLLSAAFCLKFLIFILVVSAQVPELITPEGEQRVLEDVEFLNIQFSYAHWNLLASLLFIMALTPVLNEVFSVVNRYSQDPET